MIDDRHPDASRVPGVGKIAVLRANAIGDFIFALPALASLRAAYPEAEIVLLGREWHRAFLAGRPGPVDRVIPIPPLWGDGHGFAADVPARERELALAPLARERFDIALQLHGGGRHSNPLVRDLNARVTAGLRAPDAPPLDRWVPYSYWQPEIARYIEAVGLVGASPVTLEPRVEVIEADRAEAARILPQMQAPIVALHPGATDPRRRWPPEKFAAVGDALARRGAMIVVTGTALEEGIVRAVVGAMREPATDLCARLSLGGLTGQHARCALVISNDSGPLHMARSVRAPTVGLYWCGNALTAGWLTAARHRPILSWNLCCPVCGLNCLAATCEHRDSFIADIAVEDVLVASDELLDLSSR